MFRPMRSAVRLRSPPIQVEQCRTTISSWMDSHKRFDKMLYDMMPATFEDFQQYPGNIALPELEKKTTSLGRKTTPMEDLQNFVKDMSQEKKISPLEDFQNFVKGMSQEKKTTFLENLQNVVKDMSQKRKTTPLEDLQNFFKDLSQEKKTTPLENLQNVVKDVFPQHYYGARKRLRIHQDSGQTPFDNISRMIAPILEDLITNPVKLDVEQEEKIVNYKINVAKFDANTLKISLVGDVVTVEAVAKETQGVESPKEKDLYRSFAVPHSAGKDDIHATLSDDGMLCVSIPKPETIPLKIEKPIHSFV